jgi:predicted membrane channel-forming protein YqfA (hemolysin III family)
MRISRWALLICAVILVQTVQAQTTPTTSYAWVNSLRTLAYALGWLMMVFMGVKWIVAESANERADSKKGMIYIVLGLLVVASACPLMQLYCDTADKSIPGGIHCDLSVYGCASASSATTTLPPAPPP